MYDNESKNEGCNDQISDIFTAEIKTEALKKQAQANKQSQNEEEPSTVSSSSVNPFPSCVLVESESSASTIASYPDVKYIPSMLFGDRANVEQFTTSEIMGDMSNSCTSIGTIIKNQHNRDEIKHAKKINMRTNRRRKRGPEPSNSAIYYYRMDVLEKVAEKYPEASPNDIIDIVQQQWDSLDGTEREEYHRLAQLDQQRYHQEAKQFIPRSEGGTMKRPKRKKHPKAPKHPMSAYLYFVADYRPRLKEMYPEKNFTEIARMLGEKWKTIVGEERQAYQDRADNDKKRYREEKMAFEPSPLALENCKKRKKHPLAPKHPLSGYLYFVANNRAEFNRLHPDKDFTEVAKLLGDHWKQLPSGEKRKYQILAAADKKRYEEEKEKWQPPDERDEDMIRMPKKALTAYSFWAYDERARLLQNEPNIDKRELTRRLRTTWNQLPAESKMIYNEQAESDRQRYQHELSLLPKQYRPRTTYRRQRRQERLMRVSQDILDWSPSEVSKFLESSGFSPEISQRFKLMKVCGNHFVQLSSSRIRDRLGVLNVEDRRRICRAIWILSL